MAWAYRKERPLRTFDKMLADNLVEMYQESGIETYAGYVASRIIKEGDEYIIHFENGETLTRIKFRFFFPKTADWFL